MHKCATSSSSSSCFLLQSHLQLRLQPLTARLSVHHTGSQMDQTAICVIVIPQRRHTTIYRQSPTVWRSWHKSARSHTSATSFLPWAMQTIKGQTHTSFQQFQITRWMQQRKSRSCEKPCPLPFPIPALTLALFRHHLHHIEINVMASGSQPQLHPRSAYTCAHTTTHTFSLDIAYSCLSFSKQYTFSRSPPPSPPLPTLAPSLPSSICYGWEGFNFWSNRLLFGS